MHLERTASVVARLAVLALFSGLSVLGVSAASREIQSLGFLGGSWDPSRGRDPVRQALGDDADLVRALDELLDRNVLLIVAADRTENGFRRYAGLRTLLLPRRVALAPLSAHVHPRWNSTS